MPCAPRTSLIIGLILALSPMDAFAQGNPWIVGPQDGNPAGDLRLPRQEFSTRQQSPDRYRRPASRSYGSAGSQQPYERLPAYGNYQRELWTNAMPNRYAGSDTRSDFGSAEASSQGTNQPAIQRRGQYVPSYATGHFGKPRARTPRIIMQYPPPGYDPTLPGFGMTNARRFNQDQGRPLPRHPASSSSRQYAARDWPQRQAPAQYPWAQSTAPTRSGQSTWSYRADSQATTPLTTNPPWAVNPYASGYSRGFEGPSTFGNPFGSPFSGLTGPYGFPNALGLSPGVLW